MGITNFASYGDDTKPDRRCHFSVNKNMRVGTIETKLIHHINLTCEQHIGKQTSKNNETFFLTNHSLSFAYSPPTLPIFSNFASISEVCILLLCKSFGVSCNFMTPISLNFSW